MGGTYFNTIKMNHQGGDGGGVGEAEVGQGDFKEVRFVICDCVVV